MKLFSQLASQFESSDTSSLVYKSIQNQDEWLEELRSYGHFEASHLGDCLELGDLHKLSCFGDDEANQMPIPQSSLDAFTTAKGAHLSVHHEIEEEHPLIWMFWASGSSPKGLKELASGLAEMSKSGATFLSPRAVGAAIDLADQEMQNDLRKEMSMIIDESVASYPPLALLFQTGSLGIGDQQIDLTLKTRSLPDQGGRYRPEGMSFQATVSQGDPALLSAIIKEAMDLEAGQRQALDQALEYLDSRLKATMTDVDQAQSSLQGQLSDAIELHTRAARLEDEDYKAELRHQALPTISELL